MRLTKNSKAIKLLLKQFANGEICSDRSAKQVWASSAVFMKYKLDNFRTRFNAIK